MLLGASGQTHNLLRHLPHDLVILGPLLGGPVKSFSQSAKSAVLSDMDQENRKWIS